MTALSGKGTLPHSPWQRQPHSNARRIVARVLLTLTLVALFAGSSLAWHTSSAKAHSTSSLSASSQKSSLAAQTVSPWGWSSDASTRYWLSGDFNGDGKTDINYVTDASGHVFFNLAFSNGDGTYSTVGWTPTTADNNPWPWFSGSNATWLAGDFNGDGRTDLAYIWNNNGLVEVYLAFSNGDGSFNTAVSEPTFGPYRWGWSDSSNHFWTTGDFNGDGKTDLAYVINNNGHVAILTMLSNGDATFNLNEVELTNWPWVSGSNSSWLTGDFDGNGQTDFAYLWNNNGYVEAYTAFSNGDSTFSTAGAEPAFNGARWGWYNDPSTRTWLAGDFNGDGKTDIAYVIDDNGNAAVLSMFSNGDGSFALSGNTVQDQINPSQLIRWKTSSGQVWVTGDANGDGKADIIHLFEEVVPDSNYPPGDDVVKTQAFLSRGDGNFDGYDKIATYQFQSVYERVPWSADHVFLWGDFNGDHIPDFVYLSANNGQVADYTEFGTNQFSFGNPLYNSPIGRQPLGWNS